MREGLLFAVSVLLLIRFSVPQNVICYESIDKNKGECVGFLGDDVSEEDCCLSFTYGFKRNHTSPCEACHEAEWSEWSPWASCTVSCLEGVKQRRRACYGKGECPNASTTEILETAPCIKKDCCPVPGGWSAWLDWSPCSVTCNKGIKTRKRICNNPPPKCDGKCEGNDTDTDQCELALVCPTHGSWGSWQSWSGCTGTCKDESGHQVPSQTRRRTCSNPPPSISPPGSSCTGLAEEKRQCTWLPLCPVNGNWGQWSAWSDCPVTCGVGRRRANRACDNPAPRHNGHPCPGNSITYKSCIVKVHCPVDGKWSEWSDWAKCERPGKKIACTKYAGQQHRTRNCTGRNFGGNPCDGGITENRLCYDINGCILSGQGIWSEWSAWSNCNPHCGSDAKKTQTRICQPIYPNYSMTIVTATKRTESVFFWGTPRQACASLNSQKLKLQEAAPCLNVPDC